MEGNYAGTKTLTCNILGTVECLHLTMETTTTLGNIVCNLENGGTLTIDDDLTLISAWSSDTDVMLDAGTTTGTRNVLNLGGSLIGC